MLNPTKSERRLSLGAIIVLLVPIAALVAEYAIVNHLRLALADQARYFRHREFWGGNPSEIFSHWLDIILMSGGAAGLAWLLSVEAHFSRRWPGNEWPLRLAYGCGIFYIVLSGVVAIALDELHGEGTVIIAYLVFSFPYLLHHTTSHGSSQHFCAGNSLPSLRCLLPSLRSTLEHKSFTNPPKRGRRMVE